MTRASLVLTFTLALGFASWWRLAEAPTDQRQGSRAGPERKSGKPAVTNLGPPASGTTAPASAAPSLEQDPFASRAACLTLWANGERPVRRPGTARFASWNLHWFPDGRPKNALQGGADLAWMACILWWLDVDVVAVQEVKQTARAVQAFSTLLAELSRLSGARYTGRLDDCGTRVSQHVGLIWNEATVQAEGLVTLAALNPSGEACKDQLRPGFGGRFRFTGGLDLQVISVHFKSMSDPRSLALRQRSFGALQGVLADTLKASGDQDLLVLGDMNTMGCEECAPVVTAADELGQRQQQLARAGLRLLPADAPGTHFHEGVPVLLDHALGSRSMRELEVAARTQVAGSCKKADRAPRGRGKKQLSQQLSDHCPIAIELLDRDFD